MTAAARAVDAALEATVVGSFSRAGPAVRRRLDGWEPVDLTGRRVLVTGATSGIGLAIARQAAAAGATVHFLARDRERAERAAAEIGAATYGLADLGDLSSLRHFAADVDAVDVLVHNAGALHQTYETTADGLERTFATHVVGPVVLTTLLLPALRSGAAPGRVLTMSSGGMYTQRFRADRVELDREGYDGTVAYARAKRAQVALNREWARRIPPTDVVFHALHPGWVDTPGIAAGLPGFARLARPLLRRADDGADTTTWLAGADAALRSSGDFWLDRRRRGIHHLPWTRGGDDPAALWERCAAWVS